MDFKKKDSTTKSVSERLWTAFCVFSGILVVVTMGMHLAGIWRIQVGESLELSFDNPFPAGLALYGIAGWQRDKVGALLSAREGDRSDDFCKKRRRLWRFGLCLVWFVVFGVIYAVGQAHRWHEPYELLGTLDLFDLGVTWFYGMVAAWVLIPPPRSSTTASGSDVG